MRRQFYRHAPAHWVWGTFIAVVITLSAFSFISRLENKNAQADFLTAATEHTNQLETHIQVALNTLISAGAYFDATDHIDRNMFHRLVSPMSGVNSVVQAIEWVPRVVESERENYIASAHLDGYPQFTFTERLRQGVMTPAGKRAEYYPAFFVEPLEGNSTALGFDLASDPERRTTLNLAAISGTLYATGRITLVQEQTNQYGFLVLRPVYHGKIIPDDQAQRITHLAGFVLAVFRIGKIVESFDAGGRTNVQLILFDNDATAGTHLLYPRRLNIDTASELPASGTRIREIQVAGRTWSVYAIPKPGTFAPNHNASLSVLILGLLASILLAINLRNKSLRVAEIENIVSERTHELNLERIRLQTLLKTASDGIHIMNNKGILIEANDAFLRMLGYDNTIIGQLNISDWDASASKATIQWQIDHLVNHRSHLFFETRHRHVNGSILDVEINAVGIEINGEIYLYAASRDITDRKKLEQQEQFRRFILEILVNGDPLTDILSTIARNIEQRYPHCLCCILLAVNEGKNLKIGAAPSLPMLYNTALDDIAISTGIGAAFIGQHIIVDDISTHPCWEHHKKIASGAGLFSCWSQPVYSSSKQLLGALVIYHRKKHTPDSEQTAIVEQASVLVNMVIERKHAEEALHLAASVFTFAREGIMITDARGHIIDVNTTFINTTGYQRHEVLGKTPHILYSDRHSTDFYLSMWQELIRRKYWHGEIWNRRKNGEVHAEMLTISAVVDARGDTQQYVALFSDIAALKEQEHQLQKVAHYDVLTGLPNRALLADRLQQSMAQAQRQQQQAVLYLDLDDFKSVNDNYGHDAGDRLLIELATRMKQCLREGDTIARMGGDEFVIILLDLESTAAGTPILIRLLTAASQPVLLGEVTLQVSASIGVTFYPQEHHVDADQLLRQADQAMYQAKLEGKNHYAVFNSQTTPSVL